MRSLPHALLLTALAPAWVGAADKMPDSDLLEFLGSVGADGSDWSEYLERTNLDRLAKPAAPKKPGAPAATAPVPRPVKAVPPPAANQPEGAK